MWCLLALLTAQGLWNGQASICLSVHLSILSFDHSRRMQRVCCWPLCVHEILIARCPAAAAPQHGATAPHSAANASSVTLIAGVGSLLQTCYCGFVGNSREMVKPCLPMGSKQNDWAFVTSCVCMHVCRYLYGRKWVNWWSYGPLPHISGFSHLLESLGIFSEFSRTWKVVEDDFGPGMPWNSLVVQINERA